MGFTILCISKTPFPWALHSQLHLIEVPVAIPYLLPFPLPRHLLLPTYTHTSLPLYPLSSFPSPYHSLISNSCLLDRHKPSFVPFRPPILNTSLSSSVHFSVHQLFDSSNNNNRYPSQLSPLRSLWLLKSSSVYRFQAQPRWSFLDHLDSLAPQRSSKPSALTPIYPSRLLPRSDSHAVGGRGIRRLSPRLPTQ